jgi:hypothetical protein
MKTDNLIAALTFTNNSEAVIASGRLESEASEDLNSDNSKKYFSKIPNNKNFV